MGSGVLNLDGLSGQLSTYHGFLAIPFRPSPRDPRFSQVGCDVVWGRVCSFLRFFYLPKESTSGLGLDWEIGSCSDDIGWKVWNCMAGHRRHEPPNFPRRAHKKKEHAKYWISSLFSFRGLPCYWVFPSFCVCPFHPKAWKGLEQVKNPWLGWMFLCAFLRTNKIIVKDPTTRTRNRRHSYVESQLNASWHYPVEKDLLQNCLDMSSLVKQRLKSCKRSSWRTRSSHRPSSFHM